MHLIDFGPQLGSKIHSRKVVSEAIVEISRSFHRCLFPPEEESLCTLLTVAQSRFHGRNGVHAAVLAEARAWDSAGWRIAGRKNGREKEKERERERERAWVHSIPRWSKKT